MAVGNGYADDHDVTPPLATIAHVLHSLHFAGAEVLAAGLARKLSQRYRFVFFCLDDIGALGEQLRTEGFAVHCLGRQPGISARTAFRLRRAVRRERVDLLHAHQYTPFFYAAAARGLAGRPPIIFTEHGRHWPDVRRERRVLANRLLLKPTDHVTAVGDFIRQMLVDNEGIEHHRIQVIYNGIDPQMCAVGDRPVARRTMGAAEDEQLVLQVARFHPVKDHETALQAFARVLEHQPRTRLVLVGDGPLRADMAELAIELGIAPQVTFMGARQDVAALLPGADVFMLSSLSEGISVTLLEAMGARLPIVATAVGGNPEVVGHGRNGLLSPRRDSEAIGRNLLAMLRDEQMRIDAGEAGFNRLLKHFTQAQMHDSYETVYRSMLG